MSALTVLSYSMSLLPWLSGHVLLWFSFSLIFSTSKPVNRPVFNSRSEQLTESAKFSFAEQDKTQVFWMRADCNMEAGDGNHESSPRRRQQQPGSPVPTKQPISDCQETASTKHPASRKSSKSFSDSSTTYTIGFGFVVMTLTASIFQICVIVFRTNEGKCDHRSLITYVSRGLLSLSRMTMVTW